MPTPPRTPDREPDSGADRKAPVDPTGPIDTGPIDTGGHGPTDPTVPDEFTFSSMFRVLDRKLPLALLPLRLEVRLWMPSTPPELLRAHLPRRRARRRAPPAADGDRARRWARPSGGAAGGRAPLRPATTPPSPGWQGRSGRGARPGSRRETAPTNPEQAPPRPVPASMPLLPAAALPAVVETLARRAARSTPGCCPPASRSAATRIGRLRRHLVGRGGRRGPAAGARARRGRRRPRRPCAARRPGTRVDPRLRRGRARRAWHPRRLCPAARDVLRDGFSELLVAAACARPTSRPLEALLEAHRYTHGLDFIPQGTPTNTTETAAPGHEPRAPDLAALRASELGIARSPLPPPRAGAGRGRPGHAASRRGRPLPHDAPPTRRASRSASAGSNALDRAGNARPGRAPRAPRR